MDEMKCERCGGTEFMEKDGHLICAACSSEAVSLKQEPEPKTEQEQEGPAPELAGEAKPENETEAEAELNPEAVSESELRTLSPETYRIVNNYIDKRRRKKRRKRIANRILGIIILLILLWVILSFLMKYNVITFIPQEFSMFSVFSKLAEYWNLLKNELF